MSSAGVAVHAKQDGRNQVVRPARACRGVLKQSRICVVRRTRPSWLVTTGAIAAVERQTASGISLASGSTAKSRFEVRGRSVTRGGLCLVPIADRRDSPVSYTHLRAHETGRNLVCRLLLE